MQRDVRFDYLKGLLVITMALYHTMNYLSLSGPIEYQYIRFVSGSFIFITGYILSAFYSLKKRSSRMNMTRMLERSLKLLLIFTFLNLIIYFLIYKKDFKSYLYIETFIAEIISIFITGNNNDASFMILLPISYLIAFAGLATYLHQQSVVATAGLILLISITYFKVDSFNINGILIGLIGMLSGRLRLFELKIIKSGLINFIGIIVVIAFSKMFNINVLTYTLGIILLLKFTYDALKDVRMSSTLSINVVKLGRYSLFCYIYQISLLFIIKDFFNQRFVFGEKIVLLTIALTIIMMVTCYLIEIMRNRVSFIDRIYRLIFA